MKTEKNKRKFLFLREEQDFLLQKNGIAKNAQGLADLQMLIRDGYCAPFRWVGKGSKWSKRDTSYNIGRFCKILSIPIDYTNVAKQGGMEGIRIINLEPPVYLDRYKEFYSLYNTNSRKVLTEKIKSKN